MQCEGRGEKGRARAGLCARRRPGEGQQEAWAEQRVVGVQCDPGGRYALAQPAHLAHSARVAPFDGGERAIGVGEG